MQLVFIIPAEQQIENDSQMKVLLEGKNMKVHNKW